MISVEEAKSLIADYTAPLSSVRLDVTKSAGYVLAEDVLSPIDMPPFAQSAMAGYALGIGSKNAGSDASLRPFAWYYPIQNDAPSFLLGWRCSYHVL
jgi:molybdopterin biosynthesis enzyme